MSVAFARENLLADISERELAALSTRLVEDGEPDAITESISAAQGAVDLYAGRYLLDVAHERRLISAIAIWHIVKRVGEIEEKRQKHYDEAMRELRDIRDGKFAGLIERDPLPSTVAPTQGGGGSATRIDVSRF